MHMNLPDCMYDYRPSVYDEYEDTIESDTYCERCGREITEEQYDELEGYCEDCDNAREEEGDK